ncbi:MAG: hypothetical protein LCH54_15520 [Bacteroidetes bacterium]|nr:hypothetical protein [Bacteroidota bacterium]
MRQRLIPSVNRPWSYRQRQTVSWDPDALVFISAAGIPADTTILYSGAAQEITGLEICNALNQLVLDLKTNSLWTAFYALHPIIGGNSTAHSKNLINPALQTMSFVGSPTHNGTGVLFNGTTQSSAVTHVHPDNQNVCFGVYTRNAPIGYYIDGDNGRMWLTDAYIKLYGTANAPLSGWFNTGLVSIFRNNNTQSNFKRNSGTIQVKTDSLNNLPITYDYRHSNRSTRAPFNMSLSYKSRALTNAEFNTFYTIVQTFQTSLKRQV